MRRTNFLTRSAVLSLLLIPHLCSAARGDDNDSDKLDSWPRICIRLT